MDTIGLIRVVAAVTALKLLLIPSYHSSDFEVHRNWMAITYSLPVKEWYIDNTSDWTLDYPPLFAWFEYSLAFIGQYFDPEMLILTNQYYASDRTVLFQRLSVIVTDMVFITAAWFAAKKAAISKNDALCFLALTVGNVGLLMVDHIHFQYNGLLIGILLWSVLAMESEQYVLSATLYSILLNMKHLFVYSAPLYFCYLLKRYCLLSGQFWLSFLKLAGVVLLICSLSFGPFILYGQIPQVLARLFPFRRGLCHSYWAPNVWALYAFADKILAFSYAQMYPEKEFTTANMAGGLVGETQFLMLPEVASSLSLALVFLFAMLPALLFWRQPVHWSFMEGVAYSNLCGFLWGYHVHEKAILPVLIPLIFVGVRDTKSIFAGHRRHFFFLSTLMHYSLTPLLHEPREYPIRLLLVMMYAALVAYTLSRLRSERSESKLFVNGVVGWMELLLLLALVLSECRVMILAISGIRSKYEFLPLMTTSVLCSIGISSYWIVWTTRMIRLIAVETNISKLKPL